MSAPADDPFAGYCPPDWPAGGPVPPVDPLVKECFHETSELYLEAARRLPIADIPYLARCLSQRGLAVGLCDPVTNILLTTLYGFALDKEDFPGLVLDASREEALQQTKDRLTFVDAIHRSRLGLIEFMTCYFRYLTYDEAKHCLTIAGHDLPLAVSLVQKSCGSLLGHPDPDSATTKEAFGAGCPQRMVRSPKPRASYDIKVPTRHAGSCPRRSAQWKSSQCRMCLQNLQLVAPPMVAPASTNPYSYSSHFPGQQWASHHHHDHQKRSFPPTSDSIARPCLRGHNRPLNSSQPW